MTRQKLNAAIQTNDADRLISNPDEIVRSVLLNATRQLTGIPGVETSVTDSDDVGIFTPSSSSICSDFLSPGVLTPGSDYSGPSIPSPLTLSTNRCPLCPPGRPPFYTPESLRQHLDSPVHAPHMFHCPISLLPDIQGSSSGKGSPIIKSFSTLSGLAQHLESGACGGAATFRKAAEYIEVRLKEMGIRTVKLLK
jgi:hypothetical protein